MFATLNTILVNCARLFCNTMVKLEVSLTFFVVPKRYDSSFLRIHISSSKFQGNLSLNSLMKILNVEDNGKIITLRGNKTFNLLFLTQCSAGSSRFFNRP